MKRVINVPNSLDRQAKLKAAVSEEVRPVFKRNRLGFPIFPSRRGVVVTNEMVNRIREAEGI